MYLLLRAVPNQAQRCRTCQRIVRQFGWHIHSAVSAVGLHSPLQLKPCPSGATVFVRAAMLFESVPIDSMAPFGNGELLDAVARHESPHLVPQPIPVSASIYATF